MKDYCFNCKGEEFIPILVDGEEVGRECLTCGSQELDDDYYFENGDIKKF